MSLNSVRLIGFVGRDPEIRYMPNGEPVAELSVATTETWTDKQGERQESTEWHRVKVYGKRVIENFVAKYVKLGSQVTIGGSLRTRQYTDKEQVKRWVTEIRCDDIQLLDRKPKTGEAPPAGSPADERGIPEPEF